MRTAWPPIQGATVAILARKLQLDPKTLESTIRSFNATARADDDDHSIERSSTRRRTPKSRGIAPLTVPPFSAFPLRPGITFTYFGLAVDEHLRVVRQDGSPVSRLFAAGMIMAANVLSTGYLSGLGITISTVFGRMAGETAARVASDRS